MTRLIVLPLPAASRPSKTTTSRAPSARTHSWSFTSSVCSRNSSRSYSERAAFRAQPCLSCLPWDDVTEGTTLEVKRQRRTGLFGRTRYGVRV